MHPIQPLDNQIQVEYRLPQSPAVTALTAQVFATGQLCYLQALHEPAAAIGLASIVRSIETGRQIELRWLAGSTIEPAELAPGKIFRLSTGEKRILYVVEGTLVELVPGDLGGALVALPEQCAGYNRRRHPRYELLAATRIEPAAGGTGINLAGLVLVDLSLGGFGLRTADPGWPVGCVVRFDLEMAPVQTPSGLSVAPGLHLQGLALLRRRVNQAEGGMLLGFEFADMSGYRESVLQFWLDTFCVYLRER